MSYGYTDYAQYVFSNSTILYIVIVPILTMRLFAEEKKQRTDRLLYTSQFALAVLYLESILHP